MPDRVFEAADYQSYVIEDTVADASFISPVMNSAFEHGYVSIIFYADASLSTPVQPTGGTITIDASETGQQYGEIASGLAATEFGPTSTYTRPTFSGSVRFIRITLAGVTGAGYFVARVARFCNG